MKEHNSLKERTILATVISSFIIGLTALFIGFFIYGSDVVDQYVHRSFEIAKHTWLSAKYEADTISLSKEVMGIYRSLSQEQRESEDYLSYYSRIPASEEDNEEYGTLRRMLAAHVIQVDDVYLAMYDRDTSALVYIVDPDPDDETRLELGEWESVEERECVKFLDWDGTGSLYDISNTEKYGWMCTAGYPVRDDDGEICYFILVDVNMDKVFAGLLNYAVKVGLALLAATALIAWLVSKHMQNMIIEPINKIAKAAASYAEDRKNGIEKSHFTEIDKDLGYEIRNLAEVMSEMETELTDHEKYITGITAEKERINTELDMARRIQTGMLPGVFPPYPEHTEFDIYASMEPAREVGGDFYDFFMVDEDHLCMVIADVSDKGIPAALFMMTARTTIQSYARMGASPAEILWSTNEVICGNNKMQMFVTVWAGILELSTGRVMAANAGHEYPALKKDGAFTLLKDKHGLVIGAKEDIQYRDYELTLEPGDKIFVYTDGVTEAADAEGHLFGTGRMIDALNEDPDASPEQILKNVRKAVDEFVQGAEQSDDLTMLCIEYRHRTEPQ